MDPGDAVRTVALASLLGSACAAPNAERPGPAPAEWAPPPTVATPAKEEEPRAGSSARGGNEGAEGMAAWRDRVVAAAQRQVGRTHVRGDRSDCAGFVRAAFRAAGLSLPMGFSRRGSAAEAMAMAVRGRLHLRALPGDLAFFHDTYDRNRDGELGDPFSHVAIVEHADAHGRVTLIHFGGHGVARIVLDVTRPSVHRDGDLVVNDYLRVRHPNDPPGTHYLAGELLAGFGTPQPLEDAVRIASARRAPRSAPRRPSVASP